jgi:hypothetical protein
LCDAPAAAGAPCTEAFGCTYPLVCNFDATGATTCRASGADGARCVNDESCVKPDGCSAVSSTCGPITWKAPGDSCDGDLARCLVGPCNTAGGGGSCPAVLADGSPCNHDDRTQVCDVAAVCFAGKCVPASRAMCP